MIFCVKLLKKKQINLYFLLAFYGAGVVFNYCVKKTWLKKLRLDIIY